MTRGQRDRPDLLQEALDRLILRTLLFGPRYYRLTRAGKRRVTEAIARVMRPSEEEG
jgi:hypothetical protein